MAAVA